MNIPRRLASRCAMGASFGSAEHLLVSVGDSKRVLDNGVPQGMANAPPDPVAIMDINSLPPRLRDEIRVPGRMAGPPLQVAVALDESIALVTAGGAALRIDDTPR